VLSIRQAARRARLAPIFIGGASDRLDETFQRVRHPARARATNGSTDWLEESLEGLREGLAFLDRTQRADGMWRGFMLTPGASTDWVSAHVAFLLEDVAEACGMRERAATGLLAHAHRRAGWGYNLRVGIDSDSTAQAILVLQRAGHEIKPAWVRRLLAARHDDGGFATYVPTGRDHQPRTWWEMPHADVTLIVLEALRRLELNAEERREASAWLSARTVDGVLPAHWWTDPAYSLWAQARAGFDLAATSAAAGELLEGEQRPVYLAMLIAARLVHGDWSEQLELAVARLARARLRDGSWPCAPCLRNTRADHRGGFDAPGTVYTDRYRAFSTAHAVAALSRAVTVSETTRAGDGLAAPR
jgi:hypothetical protein